MFGFFRDICQRCWPKESLEDKTDYVRENNAVDVCLMAAFTLRQTHYKVFYMDVIRVSSTRSKDAI